MTRQGAVAHWLYILASGKGEVRVSAEDGSTKAVATIDAPGFFGEMGLMTGEPRFASVVALADAECYRLEKAGFEKILRDRPTIAHGISELLAKRRVELLAIREGLDDAARSAREKSEQERILGRIQTFFGL
jgi:CRP-like cAMP-binding protein